MRDRFEGPPTGWQWFWACVFAAIVLYSGLRLLLAADAWGWVGVLLSPLLLVLNVAQLHASLKARRYER